MAQTTWTKQEGVLEKPKSNALKFVIAGVILLAAVIFLIVNALSGGTQLFLTVEEFYDQHSALTGRDVRVSGWVLEETIEFTQVDATTTRLEFDIADDLENPGRTLHIVALNEPLPDLLQGDAQALVEGRAGDTGVFHANPGGLLLKCPTRYEEGEPVTHGQTN